MINQQGLVAACVLSFGQDSSIGLVLMNFLYRSEIKPDKWIEPEQNAVKFSENYIQTMKMCAMYELMIDNCIIIIALFCL